MGALKAAEAEAPASPSKEDSERSIENGETPLFLPEKTLVSPRLPFRSKNLRTNKPYPRPAPDLVRDRDLKLKCREKRGANTG